MKNVNEYSEPVLAKVILELDLAEAKALKMVADHLANSADNLYHAPEMVNFGEAVLQQPFVKDLK